jgi:hypothetical protein
MVLGPVVECTTRNEETPLADNVLAATSRKVLLMANCILCRAETSLYVNDRPLCSACERKLFTRPGDKPQDNRPPFTNKATA